MKALANSRSWRYWAAGMLLAALAHGPVLAQAELTGEAWRHADQAYRAFARKDFKRAVREAERAAQLRPDLPRLRSLVDTARKALDAEQARQAVQNDPLAQVIQRARSLQAQGRLQASLAAWDEALRLQPQDAQLQAQRRYVARSLALPVAQEAYDAFARGDMAGAAQRMERALEWDPDPLEWHVLSVDALLAQGAMEPAREAVRDALQKHPQQSALLLAQAYTERNAEILQPRQAEPDTARLAADLALAVGDGPAALRQIQWLRGQDPEGARERELLAQALMSNVGDAASLAVLQVRPPPPRLRCTPAADGSMQCDASYDFSPLRAVADAVYAGTAAGRWESIRAATDLLVQWQPGHIGYRQWQVTALLAVGQVDAARQAAQQGLSAMDPALWRLSDVEMATLAHVAEDYGREAQAYAAADDAGTLTDTQLQDAGYAAERVGDSRVAASRFRRVIAAQQAGKLALEPQKLQDFRVAVGALERTWGASAGVFASGGGASLPGASASTGRSVQMAAEWFWRPEPWRGYGTHTDLYVRGTGNLYSAAGERTGWASLQPIVGLRTKPLAEHNLVLAGERLFKAGVGTRDDWLVRMAYSATHQMLGPVAEHRWMTTDGYAEAGRYLRSDESYFTSELRHGPQWRLAARSGGDWTLRGYGVLAVDRNNVYATPWSASAGLGIGLRRWLRDDAYNAGRSWLDLVVQYRKPIHGDPRNSGWVLRLNWNH